MSRASLFFWSAFALLVVVRLPSLAQPAGADQSLYSYVAQEIARGGVPYRDAWDQKPPGIHYTYAALRAIWPDEAVVNAADLAAAALVALLLVAIGRQIAPGVGETAALLFLLYGNPGFTRLGGVRLRSQCETFIALAIAAAVASIYRASRGRRTAPWMLTAGALLGLAFVYKYNALVYALPVSLAAVALGVRRVPHFLLLKAGGAISIVLFAAPFALAGSFSDLWQATVTYNLGYSGETYDGPLSFVRYLVSFPIQQARLDVLWFFGGLGCLVALWQSRRDRHAVIALAWVAAACVSIAVNGSRNLPQYFVQADPSLALAAGLGAVVLWRLRPLPRAALIVVLIVAALRVTSFDKVVDYTRHDLRYLSGGFSRDEYLDRFGGQRLEDKYSARAVHDLAIYLRDRSRPDDPVLVFGFSPGALVEAPRRSASRFFWSRPLVVGFNEGKPGYGADALLDELRRARPPVVVLQRNDWEAEGTDSETYFLNQTSLAAWLRAGYDRQEDRGNYSIWLQRN